MLPCPDFPAPPPSPEKTVWTDFVCLFETSLGSDLPAPLASSVLEHAVDLPAPSGGFDGNQKKEEALSSAVSASSSNRARDTASGDVKIPKWLKLGSSKSLSMRLRSPVYLVTFFYSEK
jgi:hypothetical protein